RRAFEEAGLSRGLGSEPALVAGAVDLLRQQMPDRGEIEQRQHLVAVLPGAEIAEGEVRLRRVGRALAGQVEVEPVLAVERGGRAREEFRPVPLEPDQLAALVRRVEAGAGDPEDPLAGTVAAELLDDLPGPGVEPQPGRRDGAAGGVRQPGSVALPGDGERRGAPREIGNLIAKLPERLRGRGPGFVHVLLDAPLGDM